MIIDRDNYIDAARGLHWFCVDYHDGQWSALYEVMSRLQYTPSCLEYSFDSDNYVPSDDDYESAGWYYFLKDYAESRPSFVNVIACIVLSAIQTAYDSNA